MKQAKRTIASAESVECSKRRNRNKLLGFTLKHIDVDHPILDRLGIRRKTLEHFGVGYFTGKGIMHDKVVIPFHNAEGLLVAYAGYLPEDGAITYPNRFDLRLELFNYWRCENSGLFEDGIVIVTDPLNVLRLYELGVHRVLALPTETLYAPQFAHIRSLVGDGGEVDLAPWTREYIDILAALLPHFHVRLHRHHEGSEDQFLSEVANSLGW
jgi:hypothetical protein